MTALTIKEWPAPERPREKLLHQGVKSLSDAELLTIFLRSGTRGLSALELSKQLLKKFGNLKALLDLSNDQLLEQKGIGMVTVSLLRAANELIQRYQQAEYLHQTPIHHPQVAAKILAGMVHNPQQEIMAALLLNTLNIPIAIYELTRGTINETTLYPRELVRLCLTHHASKIYLAHNHPSGLCAPSSADITLTQTLDKLLAKLDIILVDHLIICHNSCYAIKQQCKHPLHRG